jgi:hypothetical protein
VATACSDRADRLAERREELDELVAFVTEPWPTDWLQTTVDLGDLVLGVGATEPRDAIPPIDDPTYESVADASAWLSDDQPGVLVEVGDDVRFLALAILIRHEIVNDEIGGVPIAITYCPLCNTALAFDRRVDGDVLRFGVSGLLRNSDLIMWDDQTVSLWQQITGEAIVGAYSGTRLAQIGTAIVRFADFAAEYPDGLSLSRDTGFDLTYGTNPYEGYSGRFTPLMPVEGEPDHRFMPLVRVVGVSVGGRDRAYPFALLSEQRVVNDVVGGVPVVVLWGAPDTLDPLNAREIAASKSIGTAVAFDPVVGGETLTFAALPDGRFSDAQTGSTWTILGLATDGPLTGTRLPLAPHRNDFWFAWTAFFPEGDVYEG